MGEKVFDFDSGNLCLDFANTVVWHASETPEERLKSYADVVAWGEEAGLVSAEITRRLNSLAAEQPEQAAHSYQFAIQVREAIYRIFSARYAGSPFPEADLAVLNSVVRVAMAHLQLTPVGGEIHWDWGPEIESTNRILWSVARAAAELLTSSLAFHVRECEDDRGCGYLFIDLSKNHSRRWCSMESCGNRAKARRHYTKIQDQGSAQQLRSGPPERSGV
jgi:predicted RNA-binding Zn ribbon-like protein